MFKDLVNRKLIIKSLLYRFMASITIFSISFFLTKKVVLSGIISIVELLSKLILYYMYELVWKKIEKFVNGNK